MNATVVDLGPNNKGKIGPNVLGVEAEAVQALADEAANQKFRRRASDTYMCVDGRGWKDGAFPFDIKDGEWPTQVAGSKPIQDTSVALMRRRYNSEHPSAPRLSKLLTSKTKEAVANGYDVIVHGDSHKKKAGCGGNANQQETLKSNAENIDIVAPLTWSLVEVYKLDSMVEKDDVTDLILTGKHNADDEDLFDVTPEEKVEIMVEGGAKYLELQGPHREAGAAVTTDPEEAVDARAFAEQNHAADGGEIELFVATLGKAIQDTLKDGETAGKTQRDAALDAVTVILWNLGLTKELSNEELKAFLVDRI